MGTDLDITDCKECGNAIVINIGELEHPICNKVDCFRNGFPDDWEKLQQEINKINENNYCECEHLGESHSNKYKFCKFVNCSCKEFKKV